MNAKISKMKKKIKEHAPVIIGTTLSIGGIVVTTLSIIKFKNDLEVTMAGYHDNEMTKAAWREMMETGEDQTFRDTKGNPLFKMTKFED